MFANPQPNGKPQECVHPQLFLSVTSASPPNTQLESISLMRMITMWLLSHPLLLHHAVEKTMMMPVDNISSMGMATRLESISGMGMTTKWFLSHPLWKQLPLLHQALEETLVMPMHNIWELERAAASENCSEQH